MTRFSAEGLGRAPAGPRIDGDLSDEAWKQASRTEEWFETNPGDNTPPRVRNVGYLAYDERFLYVGLEFEDPDPSRIRAPLGDHDNLSSTTDYGGVLLDTRNDGRTGTLFLANARGLQYDAVSDDGGGGEDDSPDFYWDAAGRITATGWTLEIRVPFASLRYPRTDPQTWGFMLYRNYPREFRYQFFTTRLPKGTNCFVCHSNKLVGLTGLPKGGHFVAAPDPITDPVQRDWRAAVGNEKKTHAANIPLFMPGCPPAAALLCRGLDWTRKRPGGAFPFHTSSYFDGILSPL